MKMEIGSLMKRKKKIAVGLGIGIVLIASAGWSLSNQGIEADTTKAVNGNIEKYVEDIGEIKCRDSTTVYLEGSGIINQIYAEEEQIVRKGDLLLSMDQEQLEIASQTAEENYRQALALVNSGEETCRTALKAYNNTKFLAEQGAVSQWELTQKESALNNAKAVRDGYQAQLDQARLNLEGSSLTLGKQQVTAPMDGMILEKNVEVNQMGAPGTAVFVIGNAGNIEIEAKILADAAADIRLGDKAEIITRTEEKQVIKGTVSKIAPTATEETSSLGVNQKKVAVTIKPAKAALSLKLGAEADVKVITESKSNAIIVPVGAVFDYQGRSCVFTVESGRASIRNVQTGIRNTSYVEILDGLKEGETVLSAPDNSIEEGMRIKAK